MYTIKEAAVKMNLPASTIRYYDKQGLLPFVQRSESGYRMFSEKDIDLLNMIECLKLTGMPIKEIKQFTAMILHCNIKSKIRYRFIAIFKILNY